jgi:hypothetical protein
LSTEKREKRAASSFLLETAAIARKGPDAGKIYGALNWGILVDKEGRVINYKPLFHDSPAPWWIEAVKGWNVQATSGKTKNADGQVELGPFKE